jgi:hypothetical protein
MIRGRARLQNPHSAPRLRASAENSSEIFGVRGAVLCLSIPRLVLTVGSADVVYERLSEGR